MTWNIFRVLAQIQASLGRIEAILAGDDTTMQAQIDQINQLTQDEHKKTDTLNQAVHDNQAP